MKTSQYTKLSRKENLHIIRHNQLSFLLKISTLQIIIFLMGNDLETSETLYSTSFCIKSKERFSRMQR